METDLLHLRTVKLLAMSSCLRKDIVIEGMEKYEETDFSDLCGVFDEAFSEYETIFAVPVWLMKWESHTSMITIKASYQDRTAGFLQLFLRNIQFKGNPLKVGLIAKICVAPFARRKGIAGDILDFTYDYVMKSGYDILTAYANRHEQISQIFMKKGYNKLTSRYGMVRVLNSCVMAEALGKADYRALFEQMSEIEVCKLDNGYSVRTYTKKDYIALKDFILKCNYEYSMLLSEQEAEWRYLQNPQEMHNETNLLFYQDSLVGFVNTNIRDFWFKLENHRVRTVNLIIDELIYDKEHREAMKAVLSDILSKSKDNGVDNVVHFFAVDNNTVKMLEQLKFIPEIDTVLFYRSLKNQDIIDVSNITSYFDYYI